MDQILINVLNGVSSGLLLFMLSSGLTLIFSMMGVLNFAHASFYMLGAYFAYSLTRVVGFWPALVLAPIVVGLLGAVFEPTALRRVHKFGHVAELLITFGLSYVILELVQLVWGRAPVAFDPPAFLQGPAFTLVQSADGLSLVAGARTGRGVPCGRSARAFPTTRAFMMVVALAMLVALWLLLTRTRIGLVIQAALTHPEMVEALGHNVPRVFMLVFGGGCALAGLAGRDRRHHLRHRAGDGRHGRLDHLRRRRRRRHGLAGRRLHRVAADRPAADLAADGGLVGRRRRQQRSAWHVDARARCSRC